MIVDSCPGCPGDDIDLSRDAWNTLTGNMSPDRVTV